MQQFGNYLLDEEIARGGMARVYRARLRGLGGFEKTLVVKQVLPELAADPRFVRMFVEEAKTVVQMSHPHVVPVYELGIVDGIYFLAMEHVQGATLAELLREGPLSPALIAHVAMQVCDALGYAHRRFDLVHRDVTPRNVIVDSGGHVRLLDFGIAAPAEGSDDEKTFGSPGYMSPEQVSGKTVSPRSDLFSLGIVIYEAITGERAFDVMDGDVGQRAVLEGPLPRLAGREGVPSELAEMVDRMLSREPEGRPESADDVGRVFRGWLAAHHPQGVAAELGVLAERAREESERKRERRMLAEVDEPKGEPSRVVRTLATSPALEAMLEGTGEVGTGDAAMEEGTAPIASRGVVADAGERTQPISGRLGARAPEGAATGPGTEPIAARQAVSKRPGVGDAPPAREGARGRLPAAVIAAVVLTLGLGVLGLGWFGWFPAQETPTPVTETTDLREASGGETSTSIALVAPEPVETAAPEPSNPTPDEDRAGVESQEASSEESTPATSKAARAGGEPSPPSQRAEGLTGRLTINATPWAEVSMDGRPLGTTPRRNLRVSKGAHELELRCPPLGQTARVSVQVGSGSHVRVVADLTANPPRVQVR